MKTFEQLLQEKCWKGYKQVGMKDKDGKQVPNCVPESSEEVNEAAGSAFKHEYKMSKDDFHKYAKYGNFELHSQDRMTMAYDGKKHVATYHHDKGSIATDHKLNESEDQLNEQIKGWKHAHSDLAKARKDASNAQKSAVLHTLKKDGTESKMNDARKHFSSEQEARAHHEHVTKLNPSRSIKHALYVDGKHVENLGESEVNTFRDIVEGQLQEISKSTLSSYIKKASGGLDGAASQASMSHTNRGGRSFV